MLQLDYHPCPITCLGDIGAIQLLEKSSMKKKKTVGIVKAIDLLLGSKFKIYIVSVCRIGFILYHIIIYSINN